MIYSQMTIDDALNQAKDFPWAYVQNLSSMYLGTNNRTIDTNQILRASFFNAEHEIRILRQGQEMEAVCIMHETDDDCIERWQSLRPDLKGKIKKRSFLRYDEDGQAYIVEICLCGWEEE